MSEHRHFSTTEKKGTDSADKMFNDLKGNMLEWQGSEFSATLTFQPFCVIFIVS